MGAVRSAFSASPRRQVVFVGLDAAGKSTMLQTMKQRQGGRITTQCPTLGFEVETLELSGSAKFMTIHAWDVGGRHKLRVLLRLIYKDADAIIFVLDSSDREMFESARAELMDVLGEEDLAGKPLLVFANKRDLPGAVPMAEVIDKLGLHDLRSRKWFIQECVATEGQGLWEGLDWMTCAMKNPGSSGPKTVSCRPQAALHLPPKAPKDSVADDVSTADTEDVGARNEIAQS